MPNVGGFSAKFTGRKTWKIELRRLGVFYQIVPAVWKHEHFKRNGETFQNVWYLDGHEAAKALTDQVPFLVMVVEAEDPTEVHSKTVKDMVRLFEVVPTGVTIGDRGIETKVLRPFTAADMKR
jgi:hypothetical protein